MHKTTDVATQELNAEERVARPAEAPAVGAPVAPLEQVVLSRYQWANPALAVLIGYVLLGLLIRMAPGSVMQALLAGTLGLFGPGLSLVSLLYPRPGQMDGVQRMGLAALLSLAVSGITGFVLVNTSTGLTVGSYGLAMLVYSLVCYLAVVYRRRHWVVYPDATPWQPSKALLWYRRQSMASRLTAALLVALVIGGAGALFAASRAPVADPPMTEFYLLDANGRVEGFPKTAEPGQALSLGFGVRNGEREPARYQVLALADGQLLGDTGPMSLTPGQAINGQLPVRVPALAAGATRIDIILYRDGKQYRTLDLWLDVARPPQATPVSQKVGTAGVA